MSYGDDPSTRPGQNRPLAAPDEESCSPSSASAVLDEQRELEVRHVVERCNDGQQPDRPADALAMGQRRARSDRVTHRPGAGADTAAGWRHAAR
jgi:hypothetical protein